MNAIWVLLHRNMQGRRNWQKNSERNGRKILESWLKWQKSAKKNRVDEKIKIHNPNFNALYFYIQTAQDIFLLSLSSFSRNFYTVFFLFFSCFGWKTTQFFLPFERNDLYRLRSGCGAVFPSGNQAHFLRFIFMPFWANYFHFKAVLLRHGSFTH